MPDGHILSDYCNCTIDRTIRYTFCIDPVHLAIIFIANPELGFLTPPVGMNLFLSAYRFEEPMPKIYRATLPFFVIKLIAVGLITYFPFLTLSFFN